MKMKYIIGLVLIVFATACTDEFEDFNTDKKNPAQVSGEALFSNGTKSLFDQINTPNVNRNIFNLWAQHWNETTYTEETNYDIANRNQPEQVFRYFYREALKDLDEARRVIQATEYTDPLEEAAKPNKGYMIDILEIYCYQRLVDIFGAAPYTGALNIENVYPSYDMGEDIYADLMTRLNAAINGLDPNQRGFGSADLIYGGDVNAWITLANSMKLKMGIHLADAQPSTAQTAIEAAVSAGVFASRDDEALFQYQSSAPNYNPIHANLVVSGRNDYVAANTLVDAMSRRNDPRLNDYLDPTSIRPFPYDTDASGVRVDTEVEENMIIYYQQPDGSYDPTFLEAPFTVLAADTILNPRIWLGGQYGVATQYALHSQVNPDVTAATFPGILMTYSEVLFYLAEAAARGYSVGGTEEEFYNAAITESILWWGGQQSEVDDYLAIPEVAYATAEGDWKRKIGTQAWIASFVNGFLGYTTWRRLDWPVFNISPTAGNFPANATDVTLIPVRFRFPTNEQTLNEANYTAAASAIGGDSFHTKIFWDLYDANDGE